MILASAPQLSWTLGIIAALAYAVPALLTRVTGAVGARRLLWLAWLLHGVVIVRALAIDPSHFGFAQALSVTVWLVLTVYLAELRLLPGMPARWTLGAFGSAVIILALIYPGARLPATSSPWLPVHWALGLSAYGLFAAAVAHGWLLTHTERQLRSAGSAPAPGLPLLKLERIMFRLVGAGFVLLTLTVIAGIVFSEQLYGATSAGWRWDHTHVFTVLSWLIFATLLLGRWRFGWRGRHAVHMLYVGAALLLLGYAGSRFVLEVLLGRTP